MVIMYVTEFKVHLWLLLALCLMKCSLGFDPADNFLINCGSSTNASVDNRVFLGESSINSSVVLSTSLKIWVNTSSNSIPFSHSSDLYKTAQIFTGSSNFTLSVSKHGRHWIRLHFFPFVYQNYNLSHAKFSVSVSNFTLLKDFQLLDVTPAPVVKEYSLNVTSDKLVLTITPSSNSFAFLNALEVVSVPDELIPDSVKLVDSPSSSENLVHHALQTVFRVNMGNTTVNPTNDTLSRQWIPDGSFLKSHNFVDFVSKAQPVNYTEGGPSRDIAPPLVYGTCSKLNSERDPTLNVNVTWYFNVDQGFRYLVRFHFCDIVKLTGQLIFNVYINSWYAYRHLDLSQETSDKSASPYYLDVVMQEIHSDVLSVSVGTSGDSSLYPNAILNGLEIMKISNSKGLLDVKSLKSSSKAKTGLIVGIVVGGTLFILIILALVFFLVVRRRKRTYFDANANNVNGTSESGYRFSLAAILKATDNFNESLVIGVGGFGKVYKGVLTDNTEVAIKRGNSESQQGINEFRTEIEMLSHFRHRHLVSLIGYCDEQNEMILLYEYMENGTLKSHLYGSDYPILSWKQRLEICIGSAKGLYYLHTGSAKPVIHRDVKSANILLDENLMAKVADFGLSKAGPDIDKTHVSTAVKGSFGYLDPEYLIRQQLTEKSDVYSFGVVLYEVLCGRPVIDPSLPREMVNMVEWAMKMQKKGESDKIIDPNLADQIKPESLTKFLETAEKCLAECGLDRPTMGEVLWNLEHALQLQEDDASSNESDEVSLQADEARPLQSLPSTRQYSMGSAGDIVDISMNTVFSQMKKGNLK